jgi:Uma2 family endonuclease
MVAALKLPLRRMTVAEFLDWDPDDGGGRRWQLRDGRPELMAPATDRHGSIQGRLGHLLIVHLDRAGGPCRMVIAPGVTPSIGASSNFLIPDIGVTCAPPRGTHAMPEPVVLIEILSPSNEAKTRANARAYASIASVAEILVVHAARIGAELLRRRADGGWPEQPELLGPDSELRLDSIGFAAPLRSAYVNSGLF